MKTYETKKGVDEYFKMSESSDLSKFKSLIESHLPHGSSVLEIGMGPGNDFEWLSRIYNVTGSDYSEEFIKRAKLRFPQGDIIQLDGIALPINRCFESLYSSKVYQHITLEQFKNTLERQRQILTQSGLIIHSFWIGGKEMDFEDMHFYYHDKMELIKCISNFFEILESQVYSEFEKHDSLFIIARKRRDS